MLLSAIFGWLGDYSSGRGVVYTSGLTKTHATIRNSSTFPLVFGRPQGSHVIQYITTLRQELRPMLRLAAPLVMAELGWMGMGIVDTMMVGRVSAEAIGAVSLGGVLFYTVAIFGSGLMLGLDTLVSQSFGAGKLMDCHRSLVSAVYFSLPLAPALMLLTWCWVPLLGRFGIHPAVLQQTV